MVGCNWKFHRTSALLLKFPASKHYSRAPPKAQGRRAAQPGTDSSRARDGAAHARPQSHPAPCPSTRWRERKLHKTQAIFCSSEGTRAHPEPCGHTHSPTPRGSSGAPRSQQPSGAALQPFPPQARRDHYRLFCKWGGASRAGPLAPSEGGGVGDQVRKGEVIIGFFYLSRSSVWTEMLQG